MNSSFPLYGKVRINAVCCVNCARFQVSENTVKVMSSTIGVSFLALRQSA